jgi:multidrug efflux system outer membrane protein
MLPSTSLEAAPSYTRLSPQEQLLPQVNIPPEYLYSLGASLSYQVDLFGQIRRAIEGAQADVAATRAAHDAVRITVVAETTRAYVDACSAGREIGVAEQSVALQARSTELTVRRFVKVAASHSMSRVRRRWKIACARAFRRSKPPNALRYIVSPC